MLCGYRKPQNIAVFISGGGSTLQALLEMQHQFNVALVVSNKKSAYGLKKAKRFGKTLFTMNKDTSFGVIDDLLEQHNISGIFLAGFMKMLPTEFVNKWKSHIINIHPSLLPHYKGLNSAEKSWADNFDMGVSIHHVIPEMDEGELLLQKISLKNPQQVGLAEAEILLRRTEQHLLREITYGNCL